MSVAMVLTQSVPSEGVLSQFRLSPGWEAAEFRAEYR